jgi:Ca-activated chloride channel family protein
MTAFATRRDSRLTVALLLALVPSLAWPQPPRVTPTPRPPTFEVGIEVIHLNVTVTDGRNQYVTSLKSNDFAVFEDGVKQELTLFNNADVPISLVLMMDTSVSMQENLPSAQQAAIRFVKTLRPKDFAQVVQFNDRDTTLQDFSSDTAALEAAILRTQASGPTALHNSLYVSLKNLAKQKKAGELRRLAVILLSDGEDTASLVSEDQVIDLARKTEIGIYAISLRSKAGADRKGPAFSQAAHLLTVLSRETGGQVYFPNSLSELDSVYGRIAEELRTQYNLGYISSNKRRDGKWRRIVVRTPVREDVQVRHKIGYFAPRG